MSQPFVGEIRSVAFTFAPSGWAFCNGQLLSIAQNTTLFTLIGTTYGGDGVQTFGLPNLQGRAPIHQGNNGSSTYVIGQNSGQESVALIANQIPSHTHAVNVRTPNASGQPTATPTAGSSYLGTSFPQAYHGETNVQTPIAFSSKALGLAGSSASHENRQPFLVINYVISLFGIFPSRN